MSTSPSGDSLGAALNIHDAVAQNKRRTNILIVAFILLIAGVVAAMGALLTYDVLATSIFTGVGVAVAVFIALLAYRASDKIVLSISGAKEVQRSEYPDLVRTVENMAIASGLPMPKVYVIEDSAPNAFATGRDPAHASVAITTGLLEKLDKLELEGVMAHEMSHIQNLDTRLMVVTAVLVGFIALLADVMLRLTWFGAGHRGRNSKSGGGAAQIIVLVIAIVAIILAPIAAKLIQLAISRQREHLADASGALLTRYPEGLASALEKMEADTEPLEVA
ncbi:MAG: M48 family metalloprotease, partial [Dehalococcoidia bacterium]